MALLQPYHEKRTLFDGDGGVSVASKRSMAFMASNAAQNYNLQNYSTFYNGQHGAMNHDLYRYYHSGEAYVSNTYNGILPSSKRRRTSTCSCKISGRPCEHHCSSYSVLNQAKPQLNSYFNLQLDARLVCSTSSAVPETGKNNYISSALTTSKYEHPMSEDDGTVFVSRDEIERSSPSRRDGISPLQETRLRYSYCAFLQDLGYRLDLPQTTIGTAMVLCHRFFFRRSHASHNRYLIATGALFLVSKSEETPRPLVDVLQVSAEMIHGQDFSVLSYMMPLDWFERYREQIIGAEHLVLTTLNFELTVLHPYESLSSTLQKLGFSSALVNLASSLVSEGSGSLLWLRTLLWLQFKPQQIAAGAAYLASKLLHMNLSSAHDVWNEFHTPSSVLKDVAHQLMELF